MGKGKTTRGGGEDTSLARGLQSRCERGGFGKLFERAVEGADDRKQGGGGEV